MTNECPHLLIVDDEPDICANMADILRDLGYQVDVAYDGPGALELVQRNRYDLALLDLRMPGMDGLELYRRIKQLSSGTVAIIVTAYATSETAASALAAGAWRVLSKPVDFSQLLHLIDMALEEPLVMLVDDDRDLCDSLWDLLRERGYRVCLAHDASAAATLLEDASFHVVMIDMKLPHGNGQEVFRLVRRANPQARTVLITGFRSEVEELIRQIQSEGADAVCYKPFNVHQLLHTVGNLAESRLRGEAGQNADTVSDSQPSSAPKPAAPAERFGQRAPPGGLPHV
jgi:DNA-binding response OmpR family regulator